MVEEALLLLPGCRMLQCIRCCKVCRRNTFKYKSGYKDWLEDLAQELVTPVTARSAPQCSSGPVGATSEHDCEKIFEKRKVCRECALSRSGTDVRASATVYGCRQCNEALHVECFGKHVRRHHL
ncbi:hypothetical protein AAFF_G00110500 [Aldrovandia affinis]|uniref:Uncharacterized protein n=1 Tax=Aldrovandia affinis TaxID=143900 RepID=A0AAD7VXG2_9TELE|nr:hypothetical protein AAFF_G00110500 [Aldrovandia affinis]